MKTSHPALPLLSSLAVAFVLAFSGCATGGGGGKAETVKTESSVPLPPGVTLTRHPHLQGIWVADGFRFSGLDAVVVPPPAFKAVERSNEINERATALQGIQDAVVVALRDTGSFASVVTRADEVKAGARYAVLETSLVEYEKGGGGARYFAGVYGAGQPVIKVRGHLVDSAGAPLFVFEARRSGESASARMFGGFRSDVEIQAEDIRDLGIDLRDFVKARSSAQ
jgi:hypothetical protein